MPETENGGALAVLAAELKELHGFEVLQVADPSDPKVVAPFIVAPDGKRIEPVDKLLDAFRAAPARRKGTAKIRDIASFVAHVNAFKDEHTAVFAVPDPAKPRLLAVYDYNEKGGIGSAKARFGQHRAQYDCELSEQWQAWTAQDGKAMTQPDFAEFLEDRIEDVCLVDGPHITELAALLEARVGGPSAMLKLSRGLQVSVNTTVHNAVTLSTGEVQVVFTEQHADGSGGPITTPNLFFLNIPVFHGGAAYQVGLRLRYRLSQGRLQWSYALYRTDKIFDDAFKGIVETAGKECEVAVYAGEPEA